MSELNNESDEIKSISLEEKVIIKQVNEWKHFLDTTIGLFSFTFAISCAGLEPKKSIIWIFLSIVVIFILLVKRNTVFPEIIRIIRNKKDKNEEDIRLLNLFDEELLKMKKPKLKKGAFHFINIKHHIKSLYHSLKETPLYWIGFLSLFGLLYYNSFHIE